MPPTRRSAAKAENDGPNDVVAKVTAETENAPAVSSPTTIDRHGGKRDSKIPNFAQFPLAVTLSFAMASLGYSLLGEFTKGELAAVSRSQDTWGEVGILAGWRIFELALGWYGNLDSLDVATLDLLSHGPSLYLLSTFYDLSPATAISALIVDITSAAVPFYLMRPLSAVHSRSASIPNRELTDIGLQLYTTALSAGIYTVIIVLSLRFILPRVLVLYFSSLPTLVPAYTASYASVLPVTVAFGAAASNFIFAPFATTGKSKEDDRIDEFDPASASLGETISWNVWGYTAKTKVVISRTAITALVTGINTFLSCTMTIYGVESTGAAAYAAVWVVAALSSGLALGLVGGDE